MTRPIFVQHRVNTAAALALADPQGGVEIDLRSRVDVPGALHLSHDPWVLGEDFSQWLTTYAGLGFVGPLVLNTKEDGLEVKISELLASHNISNYFFLDTNAPTLRACLLRGMGPHMAVRFSSVEPQEAAAPWFSLTQNGRPIPGPGWVWVDCFDGIPLSRSALTEIATRARLCLVSPELQKVPFVPYDALTQLGRMVDAVCTKQPKAWREALSCLNNQNDL